MSDDFAAKMRRKGITMITLLSIGLAILVFFIIWLGIKMWNSHDFL